LGIACFAYCVISISSAVLLNCLYLNPQVLLVVHSSPALGMGRGEWAAAWS